MLDLIKTLDEVDNKRIENYITNYGVENGYRGNESYLKEWAASKKKLYHLLDGNLIYKVPFAYEKPVAQLKEELNRLYDSELDFFSKVRTNLINAQKKYNFDVLQLDAMLYIFSMLGFCREEVIESIKIKIEELSKKTLQISKGMKTIRAMQKIITYFDMGKEIMDDYERCRIAHSLILNEKRVKGNMCFSIHPLDFITMSDNASNWSSCMSWTKAGCYRVGSVEMMNSNNVICCYIESNEPFYIVKKRKTGGDEETWNSKRWRQLVYFTKDIIVCGKSYPYENEQMSKVILATLAKLAEKNLKWTYQYGPELYQDMIHVNTQYRMDRNRSWTRYKTSKKRNILFDTKGMYNDMFNDSGRDYWCIRNKVKHEKIISYSGKAKCLCCNNDILSENDDMYYYDEGSYNDRYYGVRNLLCYSCLEDRYCDCCGNDGNGYSNIFYFEDYRYCADCWDHNIKKCPVCGDAFELHDSVKFYMPKSDVKLYRENFYDNTELGYCCEKCHKQMEEKSLINRFEVSYSAYKAYSYKWITYLSDFKYDENDAEITKYYCENLVSAPRPKN